MSGKRPGTPRPTEADLERKRLREEPGQEVFRRPVTPDDVQGDLLFVYIIVIIYI